MTTASIDTERLKAGVDLRNLAGRLVELRKESNAENSGPCPKCGGDDRFHVKTDTFFCRQCYPLGNGKAHDAIEFVIWAGLAHDFRGAADYLGGGLAQTSATIRRPAERTPKPAAWRSSAWQSEARAILARAQACLASAAGDPGAAYLQARGILSETWEAWGLGYDPAKYDPAQKRTRPAVVLPWQYREITALKYRFTDSSSKEDRFTQKVGGQQIAFGLNLAGAHFSTLWLIEGELNALSLWQALRAEYCINFDVVSFGSDSKASNVDPTVKTWAGKYQQAIVWADDPAKAAAVMRAIPGAFGLRSPVIDGAKLDANALLAEPGALGRFALAAWDRFDREAVYMDRVKSALEAAA